MNQHEDIIQANIYFSNVIYNHDLDTRKGKPLWDFSKEQLHETMVRLPAESIETFEARINARCRQLNGDKISPRG